MQEGKVSIADGPIQTRDNLHEFKTAYNKAHPKNRIKTLAEAIEKLIEIAGHEERVMKEYMKVRDEFSAYKENFQPKIEFYEDRISELEKKQLTKEESRCVWNILSDIDLCDTEDEEYSNTVKAVLRKLEM